METVRALVTGASRGIGRATALHLARDGVDVAVHFLSHESEAAATAAEVRARGREALLLRADLAEPSGATELARAVAERWDSLDILVHNAGPYPRRSFEETSEAEWRSILQVHLLSPAALTRALLPRLRRAPTARIVFVSSVLAFQGSTRGAHYAAAKAAQLGLARSLAHELAPQTTVNVVAPGSIDTAILAGDSPERRRERERAIPLGRLGSAEDVAEAISFLASPKAAYLTGTTLHVNGGLRSD